MATHEGELLDKYLKDNNLSPAKLAAILGVTAQNVYYHKARTEVAMDFKERMARAGMNIYNIELKPLETNLSNDLILYQRQVDHLKKEIESLREIIKVKDELIEALRERVGR